MRGSPTLIQAFDGKQGDNGIWEVNVAGTSLQAAVRGDHLVLAKGATLVQEIKESSETMADKLPTPVREGMTDLDLIIGINLAKLSGMVQPLIEGQLFPLLESQATSSMEKRSVEVNKQQIKMLVEGMETMVIGLRLEASGIPLRFAGSVKSGSKLAESTHMRVTDAPLLQGLPAERWAIVSGQVADEIQMKAQADNLAPMFEVFKSADGVDQKKLAGIQESLEKWLLGSRGYQMAISQLSEDSDGVVGVSVIAQCEDSREWLRLSEATVRLGRELASTADDERPLSSTPSASPVRMGVVAMKVDLSQIDEIDEDQQDMIANVIGSDTTIA